MKTVLKGPSKGGHNPKPAMVGVVLTQDCVATAAAGTRSVTVGLPPDGVAEHLRPTELILSGLGGCILTNLIITCREQNLDWQDMHLTLTNTDQVAPPRIASINVGIHLGEVPTRTAPELVKYVQANSRMYNTLSPLLPITFTLAD